MRRSTEGGEAPDEHWLAALERLVTSKQLTDQTELLTRKVEWADAYRHTPHGKPVELRGASQEPKRS